MDASRIAPVRKRRRPPLACEICRRRKVKCNRESPCDQCIRSKTPHECTYVLLPPSNKSKPRRSEHSTRILHDGNQNPGAFRNGDNQNGELPSTEPVPSLTTGSTPSSTHREFRRLQASVFSPDLNPHDSDEPHNEQSRRSPNGHAHELHSIHKRVLKGTLTKSRLLGQSHWMNSVWGFSVLLELLEELESGKHEDMWALIQKCKSLSRKLKPKVFWQPPSPDQYYTLMPERSVADKYLEAYFQTSETVYRVVHVPTFREEYENYWVDPLSTHPGFVVQMLLIFAIGSCSSIGYSRHQASHAVVIAQSWLTYPWSEKHNISIMGIQSHCLMLIAREMLSIGSDLTWVSAGSLLRGAMLIGMHRDPGLIPNTSIFHVQMRRRLWATVLEIAIQSAMNGGGNPLLATTDYDTDPPANIDDEQLYTNMESSPIPQPKSSFTQMTIALSLLETVPERLAMAKAMNEPQNRLSYQDSLQLCGSMDRKYRDRHKQIQQAEIDLNLTTFRRRMFELLSLRFLLAFHYPFSMKSASDPSFYYSRKSSIETALILADSEFEWRQNANEKDRQFHQLLVVGGGVYRGVLIQTRMTICREFILLNQETPIEHASKMEMIMRRELAARVSLGPQLTLQRIEAGETNVKGHVFTSMLAAQVQAILDQQPLIKEHMYNVGREELARSARILEDRKRERDMLTPSTVDSAFGGDEYMFGMVENNFNVGWVDLNDEFDNATFLATWL